MKMVSYNIFKAPTFNFNVKNALILWNISTDLKAQQYSLQISTNVRTADF